MRKRSRYGIRGKTVDNIRFASAREAARYVDLKLLLAAKVIRDLELQPAIPIIIGGVEIRFYSKRFHKNGRQMLYIADFRYFDREKNIVVTEDVKMESGHRTEVYTIKRALMAAMGCQITEV